jgi:hypothetical protein
MKQRDLMKRLYMELAGNRTEVCRAFADAERKGEVREPADVPFDYHAGGKEKPRSCRPECPLFSKAVIRRRSSECPLCAKSGHS